MQQFGYDNHLNEAPTQTYRQLDSSSLRTARILIHSCLSVSLALNFDHAYTQYKTFKKESALMFTLSLRHSVEGLLRKLDQDTHILQQSQQYNEEMNVEKLHCLIFNLSGLVTNVMPVSQFISEDQRNAWEGNLSLFLRGIITPT